MDKNDMENILKELRKNKDILEKINSNIFTIKFCVVLSTTLFILYFMFSTVALSI